MTGERKYQGSSIREKTCPNEKENHNRSEAEIADWKLLIFPANKRAWTRARRLCKSVFGHF
jgi:hypothetical protein